MSVDIVNELLETARARTGLGDFGDDSYLEPLNILVKSLQEEARLTAPGWDGQKHRIINLLVNRLKVEEAIKNHPEIEDEEILRPSVIVGLPRTGTTMLFRIIGEDARYFVPKFYEVRYPVDEGLTAEDGRDSRVVALEQEIDAIMAARPEMAAIHPMDANAAEEEINIIEHSFLSTMPEAFCNVPTYASWVETHDNAPAYRYLKRVLKLLQWQKKRSGETADRWILKTPHHIHHLDLLISTFPDADIILTHRDPLETIPSVASFHDSLFRLASDKVDAFAIGHHWEQKFARSMQQALAIEERNPDRFVNVSYRKLLADPVSEVARIYAATGRDFTEENVNSIRRWQEENRRDKRAPHRYDMADYGLTQQGLKASFAQYRKRHIE